MLVFIPKIKDDVCLETPRVFAFRSMTQRPPACPSTRHRGGSPADLSLYSKLVCCAQRTKHEAHREGWTQPKHFSI